MFSDPLHGGNANMIGWQLIGYPGAVMNYRQRIGKSRGEAWRRKPVSLAQIVGQIVGHKVAGWEQEKEEAPWRPARAKVPAPPSLSA